MTFRGSFFLITACLLITGCNPFFVMRGAIEEASILYNAVPIEEALENDSFTEDEKTKLKLAQEARAFSISLGLHPDDSYTSYSKLDRDVLAWVVVASEMDSFSLYTWWYPIVGSVPYKGYFHKKAALCSAESLKEDGYEVSVRPTDAISTLGWFDDPLLSTTLKRSPVEVVNTVLHEIFHQTIWIPDHVPFNESAAHFFSTMSTSAFYKKQLDECETPECRELSNKYSQVALARIDFEFEFSDAVVNLYQELEELYQNEELNRDQKLSLRVGIFDKHMSKLLSKYPELRVLREINNSEIVQLKLYLTGLRSFKALFDLCQGDFGCFMKYMEEIKSTRESKDPFDALDAILMKTSKETRE